MKTVPLLQFSLLLTILLANSSEGFFFEYPKKILMNFLQSLKEKKEAKKMLNSIDHYHVHYYPYVHVLSKPPITAPKKHELDEIHNEHLASFGWSGYEYKYVPEPKFRFPSKLTEEWHDTQDLSEIDNHFEDEDILVEVPFGHKIIIEHPHGSKKLKSSHLSTFFHKIADLKNSVHS